MAKEMSKAKTGANAVVYCGLVIAAITFFNVVAHRFFKRVDFTEDHVYTLSKSSREMVEHLPDRINVKAFISKDLQPPFSQVSQYVRDTLSEYANASHGKFRWEAIDPGEDHALEEEATKLKVPKVPRGRASSSGINLSATYLGVAFEYQGNVESIPQINGPEGLEFQITSIIKMLAEKKKKIAVASSEGELVTTGGDPRMGGSPGGMQWLKQAARQYDIVDVALATGEKPIADDVDALLIVGPKQQFSERAKFVVDQFLMKGKAVGFLVDGMVIESPRGQMQMPGMDQPRVGRKNEVGLDDLLAHYGFKVRDDFLMEPRQNIQGPIPYQGQTVLVNYPAFIVATDLDKENFITSGLKGAVLPFASSLDLIKDAQPGLQVTKLMSTTADAWRQTGFFIFDPQRQELKVGSDKGPFVLAYAATGKLKSFFAGKPYPTEKGEKVTPPPADASSGEARPLDESTGSVRIVVVGDSEFASDMYIGQVGQYVQSYRANVPLFMNIIDFLAQDQALAPVRSKGMTSRPLTVSSAWVPSAIKYGNIVGVPLLFILYGVVRWRLRTLRRRNAAL